jgi:F0F1-type ATP synthase delta subunit
MHNKCKYSTPKENRLKSLDNIKRSQHPYFEQFLIVLLKKNQIKTLKVNDKKFTILLSMNMFLHT